jgi:hypothetical protein
LSQSSQETNRATATSEVTFNNLPSLKVLIFFLSTTKISIFLFVLYTKFVILIHADETEIKGEVKFVRIGNENEEWNNSECCYDGVVFVS